MPFPLGTSEELFIWRMADIRNASMTALSKKVYKMQRQFTMELRVDYADNEKNHTMREAIQAAARHVYATASLLSDGVKPQIAIFSDDFFSGHEKIELLEDTVQKGKDMLATIDRNDDAGVSSELMAAVRDSK